MTPEDRLLLWLSARGAGSWGQFRSAVEELNVAEVHSTGAEEDLTRRGLPVYQLLRINLERMGHAEFFTPDQPDWRVAPPALALYQSSEVECLGVLVGARKRSLIDDLLASLASERCTTEVVTVDGYPSQLLIHASARFTIEDAAAAHGVLIQRDAPVCLLLASPTVTEPAARAQIPMPFGANWVIETYSATELAWRPSTQASAAGAKYGLFRFTMSYQREMLLCVRGEAFRVNGQVGKYLLMKREGRTVITYNGNSRTFAVPPICRPPLLVERALVLCSGLPPRLPVEDGSGQVVYPNVNISVAQLAAQLLGQEIAWKTH